MGKLISVSAALPFIALHLYIRKKPPFCTPYFEKNFQIFPSMQRKRRLFAQK